MKNGKFETTVTKELATHTEKLDNIQMQLNSIDRNFVHYIDRQNKSADPLETTAGIAAKLRRTTRTLGRRLDQENIKAVLFLK